MNASPREVTGFIIATSGVALVPVGWYASRLLWALAAILLVVGLLLLATRRVAEEQHTLANLSEPNPPPVGEPTPADLHNYSGWEDAGTSLGDFDGSHGDL
jgi:hypothetical protein